MTMGSFDFSLTFTMVSDWRVGSGSGRQGAIDDLIRRDEDGFPFLPVSTLRGVWRDAAEQLAFALDGGKIDAWRAAVDRLFGSQPALAAETDARAANNELPLPSRLRVTPARLSPAIRARLAAPVKAPLRKALAFVKAGVAINRMTGTARNDMLRFIETARGGAVLTAGVAIDGDDQDLADLAVCSAAMIESIGGGRRRGLGRCTVAVAGVAEAAARLKAKAAPADAADDKGPEAVMDWGVQPVQSSRFRMDIRLISPVIVPDEVLGNTVTTRDHLPGTLLIGPLARALAGAGIERKTIDEAIVGGALRVLPAYPVVGGVRQMPAPFCWSLRKDDESVELGDPPRRYARARNELCDPQDTDAWKPVREGFCHPFTGFHPIIAAVRRVVSTHNTVDDKKQAPSSDVGGVYTYEALAPDQLFAAIVEAEGAIAATLDGLKGSGRIGRASNAGYGQISFSIDAGVEKTQSDANVEHTVIYFETDCIGGQAGCDAGAVERLLKQAKIDATVQDAWLRTRRTEGWMPGADLPRASLTGIKAGSVVVLKEKIDTTAIANLHSAGLGERRAEGYGIVAVNPEWVTTSLTRPSTAGASRVDSAAGRNDKADELAGKSLEYLHVAESEAIRDAIRERVETIAFDDLILEEAFGFKPGSGPNMTQIGNLRAVIGGTLDSSRRQAVVDFLGRDKEWKNYSNTKVLFSKPDSIWSFLCLDFEPLLAVSKKEAICHPDSAFTDFALNSFFHGVAKARKRRSESAPAHPRRSA